LHFNVFRSRDPARRTEFREVVVDRPCEVCGTAYRPTRSTAKYCSPRCKKRAADKRVADRLAAERAATPRPAETSQSTALVDQVRAELEEAGRLNTVIGRQALLLATRLETNTNDTGGSAAAVSKELRAVMAEAMSGVHQAEDPVQQSQDELKKRREKRKHG
jgi:hypothetical protein